MSLGAYSLTANQGVDVHEPSSSGLPRELQGEWARLQAAIRQGEVAAGEETAKVRALLARCRSAGRYVPDGRGRDTLYMLVREIGARLQAVTNEFPPNVVEPADPTVGSYSPLASPGGQAMAVSQSDFDGSRALVAAPQPIPAAAVFAPRGPEILHAGRFGRLSDSLRRRWLLFVCTGLLCSTITAGAALLLIRPHYVSTAEVSIAPSLDQDVRPDGGDADLPYSTLDADMIAAIVQRVPLGAIASTNGPPQRSAEIITSHTSITTSPARGTYEIRAWAESPKDVQKLAAAVADVLVERLSESDAAHSTQIISALASALLERAESIGQTIVELQAAGRAQSEVITSPEDAVAKASLDASRAEYRSIRERLSQMKLESLVRAAVPPARMSRAAGEPQLQGAAIQKAVASVFGVGAFMGAAILVWAIDSRHGRLSRASDIDEGLGIRVLGTLPPTSLKALSGSSLAAAQVAEEIDKIRSVLMRDATSRPRQVVMLTSSGTMEGNSTVAASLALSLARAGRRTLLMDADLRSPSLHKLFGLPQEDGLSETLRSEIDLSDAIRQTNTDGLYVVTAGVSDMDAVQALATDMPQAIFEKLRDQFDFIILDAAPVLDISDTLSLGQYVDAAILTVLRDHSELRRVYEAAERLKAAGVRLMGCIVNGIHLRLDRRVVRLHSSSASRTPRLAGAPPPDGDSVDLD